MYMYIQYLCANVSLRGVIIAFNLITKIKSMFECAFLFVLSLTSLYLTIQLNQDHQKENVPKNIQLLNQATNLHLYPDFILVS